MVNMYSMGSMGMQSGMMGMGASGAGTNVYENYKAKYGVGYADFGTKPYAQEYPTGKIMRRPASKLDESWFVRFFKKCFIQ